MVIVYLHVKRTIRFNYYGVQRDGLFYPNLIRPVSCEKTLSRDRFLFIPAQQRCNPTTVEKRPSLSSRISPVADTAFRRQSARVARDKSPLPNPADRECDAPPPHHPRRNVNTVPAGFSSSRRYYFYLLFPFPTGNSRSSRAASRVTRHVLHPRHVICVE